MNYKKAFYIILTALIAVGSLAAGGFGGVALMTHYGVGVPEPEGVQSQAVGYSTFNALRSLTDLDVDRNANIDGTLVVDGASTLTGNVTGAGTVQAEQVTSTDDAAVTDDLTVGGLLLTSSTNITVTDGDTLTPTITTYALDSAGAVTLTLAAAGTEGQILILIGDDANDVTIADTNIRTSDGNAQVLNQYDVLMLVYQDSEWLEISNSDDS